MAGKSASLLTKTQRTRIRDDFADLDEEKKRRDQQRIRERIKSGLLDFQLLVDYPDRQLEMAFDELSDDELRMALASTTIVVERLRELNDIDRERLIQEGRTQTDDYSDPVHASTLKQIDLQTTEEIRSQTKAEVEEELEENHWDQRANRLAKLSVAFFLPFPLLASYHVLVREINLEIFDFLAISFGPAFILCALGWFGIEAAKVLKYDIIPVCVRFRRDPKAFIKDTFKNLIENPAQKIRRAWDDL